MTPFVIGDGGKRPHLLTVWMAFAFFPVFPVVAQNPYRHIANLDFEGRYVLDWTVNWPRRSVLFNVTVEATGYVSFGFAFGGETSGVDGVIGGVDTAGRSYLVDMHGSKIQELVPDQSQDYVLHSAGENGTHTSLQFSRAFDTCDDPGKDYIINNDTAEILWCYGENDDYRDSPKTCGSYKAHLLDPDWTPRGFQEASRARRVATAEERGDLKVWTVTRHQRVPDKDTVYWCSFHKGPHLEKRHHLVGFNFRWQSQLELDRTHHLLLLKCEAPEGEDPLRFYEPYVQNSTGEMCYFFLRGENGGLPVQTCREAVYAYAIGERMFFLPNHTGIPFGDNPNEYYLLQVHYDNYPNKHFDVEKISIFQLRIPVDEASKCNTF